MNLTLTEPLSVRFGVARPRLLLIASTGGHLSQLVRLADRIQVSEDSVWVTFDSPQSRSLLKGRSVLWVDYVAPRDVRGTIRAYRSIGKALDADSFDGALSTGAAVAVAGLAWARKHRLPAVYVESVSRTDGPSLSGRIIDMLRLAETYTQHSRWATSRWRPVAPVLQDFTRLTRPETRSPHTPLRFFVTLGTIRPYRFDRLVDKVVELAIPGDEFVWQLGETDRSDLPGTTHTLMESDDLLEAALDADVVVTHAGVGTILQMLDHGISPVVVPRLKEQGEHVDDHQLQIWHLLSASDLAHPTRVEGLSREVFTAAASSQTVGAKRT